MGVDREGFRAPIRCDDQLSDDCLQLMLDIVEGKAIPHLGPGITTHVDDPNDIKHRACLELEARGAISRHCVDGNAITWVPRDWDTGKEKP